MMYAVYNVIGNTIISIREDRKKAENDRDYYNKLFKDCLYVVIPYCLKVGD